jgi:hypothetical protein
MIDREDAIRQLARCDGLDFFQPLPEEAMNELVLALCRAANLKVAAAVITVWLATQTKRPTPADLNRLIHEHQGRTPDCNICCDTGIVVQGGAFAACICQTGQRAFVQDWARGRRIDPPPELDAQPCSLCRGAGLLRRDKNTDLSPWLSIPEMLEQCYPCPLCADGERTRAEFEVWRAELAQPL